MSAVPGMGVRAQLVTLESADAAAALEPGKLHVRHVNGDQSLKYFVYVPREKNVDAPLFVTVHGVSRNARQHAELFAEYAEEYGVVLVAPYFSKRRFGDYQRLGREGSGQRADLALQKIIHEVEVLTGTDGSKLMLFGFSGGGQFVHRYAMACPDEVLKVVIGAAGWYTWPEDARKYPYGTAADARLEGVDFTLQKFLKVPACVLVGQWDIKYDPGLNQSSRIQQQQGFTRLERGRRWVEAMNRAAMAHGLDTVYEFSMLRGVNHDFSLAMTNGNLGRHVFSYLYGAAPSLKENAELPVPSSQADVRQREPGVPAACALTDLQAKKFPRQE